MEDLYLKIKDSVFFIAGPCVMESYELMDEIAAKLVEIKNRLEVEIIFKSSFDKANRTSVNSYRGPGLDKGLTWLADIKTKYNIAVTTDIHESYQAAAVGQVADIIQIPAFLCRQTDLLAEAARTNKIVNIKKAQFLSAGDMKYPAEKVIECGNAKVFLTERGSIMSPGNLVVDFRNIPAMQALGFPVIMDCTHAVQKPSTGNTTGGNREYVRPVALSAKAFGANGYFFEVHPDPDKGLSDAPNMYPLQMFEDLIMELLK